MDPETQWTRVTQVVAEGVDKAKEIEELHEAATRQLDAVDYAYERMILELREVLPALAEEQPTVGNASEEETEVATGVILEAACSGPETDSQSDDQPAKERKSPARRPAARKKPVEPVAA